MLLGANSPPLSASICYRWSVLFTEPPCSARAAAPRCRCRPTPPWRERSRALPRAASAVGEKWCKHIVYPSFIKIAGTLWPCGCYRTAPCELLCFLGGDWMNLLRDLPRLLRRLKMLRRKMRRMWMQRLLEGLGMLPSCAECIDSLCTFLMATCLPRTCCV